MDYSQLEHAIRAACRVAEDTELLIFGSQAILGSFPDAPGSLRASIEVDVQPKNRPERTDHVDGALGEDSPFHQAHGFYVHGVSIEAAILPDGWEERTIRVRHIERTAGFSGLCVEAHDLAASKLSAFREKDREFVAALLVEDMISAEILRERILRLPVDSETRRRLTSWTRITAGDSLA